MKITDFGSVGNEKVSMFVLENSAISLSVTNYGARIHELKIKDGAEETDVVLGCSTLDEYIKDIYFLGGTIGRYANRIGNSSFRINGKEYLLDKNEGKNILHGGNKGFHEVVWDYEIINDTKIRFGYTSRDGENGFPGNLAVDVYYSISDKGDVIIDYEAHTDKTTVINMTNHAYFNLNGDGSGDILSHVAKINSDKITEVGPGLIPTGRIVSVSHDNDLSSPAAIGTKFGNNMDNFDWNYIVSGDISQCSAEITGNLTGIKLRVYSDQPGVQFYTGKQIAISSGKNGTSYGAYAGFCLEPQNYPDAPNHPEFPSPLLNPGETYRRKIIYSLRK